MGMAVESFAKMLHESGREAVERGCTVAAENGLPKIFLDWNEVSENVREGRRIQARWLMGRIDMTPRDTKCGETVAEAARRGFHGK